MFLIVGMSIGPEALGRIDIKATSAGILIFRAKKPVRVPTARMTPPEINVCFAISIEAETANSFPHC